MPDNTIFDHEEGLIAADEVVDERCKLLAPLFRKRLPLEFDRVVELRTSLSQRNKVVSVFVDTFNEISKMFRVILKVTYD
jgi:hypothetical protein